jgi:hypothetical protein
MIVGWIQRPLIPEVMAVRLFRISSMTAGTV